MQWIDDSDLCACTNKTTRNDVLAAISVRLVSGERSCSKISPVNFSFLLLLLFLQQHESSQTNWTTLAHLFCFEQHQELPSTTENGKRKQSVPSESFWTGLALLASLLNSNMPMQKPSEMLKPHLTMQFLVLLLHLCQWKKQGLTDLSPDWLHHCGCRMHGPLFLLVAMWNFTQKVENENPAHWGDHTAPSLKSVSGDLGGEKKLSNTDRDQHTTTS